MRSHYMPTLRALGKCMKWLPITALAACLLSCWGSGLVDGVDGPVLAAPQLPPVGKRTGWEAVVSGTVVFDENAGCLYLGNSSGDRFPVVWPGGASWQADPPAVRLKGQLIEPGMYVIGGGGYVSYKTVQLVLGIAVADAAQACADHVDPTARKKDVAFFNFDSEVEVVP